MATASLVPTSDNSVGSWTTDSGGTTSLYAKIDETIAGATDTSDYIKAPNDTDASDYSFNLADLPTDFSSLTNLQWQVRYALSGTPPGTSKDTYGLSIRVMNGATVLAANDSSGTFQVIVSTTTMSTSFTNSALTAFTYVNTGASLATWNGAVVTVRQTYTKSGSNDAHAVEVSTVELTATYDVIIRKTESFPDGLWGGLGALYLPLHSEAGSQLLIDRTNYHNNGVMTGQPAWSGFLQRPALSLDGSNDLVTIADAPSMKPPSHLTVFVAFQPGSVTGTQILMERYDGASVQFNLYLNGTALTTFIGGNATSGTTTLAIGTWYLGAAVFDGASAIIYLNGISENSAARSLMQVSAVTMIGARNGGSLYFTGKIGAAGLLQRALSAHQMRLLYEDWMRGFPTLKAQRPAAIGPLHRQDTPELYGNSFGLHGMQQMEQLLAF